MSEALEEYAVRRLTFSIGSLGPLVSHLEVRVADVNRPRGGVNKTSVITPSCDRSVRSSLELNTKNADSAINRAAVRMRVLLVRHVQRRTRVRRLNRRMAS
jgi:hypothetical protein